MKIFTEQRLQDMEGKLNGVIGRLLVPAMNGNDKAVKEAFDMVTDFAGEFTELINDELL